MPKCIKNCFAFIPPHDRARLSSSGFQCNTTNQYTVWVYDIMTNLAPNSNDTRMVTNRELTVSNDASDNFVIKRRKLKTTITRYHGSKQVINI